MIQQISNEEMQRFLESYGKKNELGKNTATGELLDMISGSGSMELAMNTTNITNNYNHTAKAGDTHLTNTTVYGDSGGRGGEQLGMLPA